MIHGVYDIDGVSLSMPAIVGADGIESDIPINKWRGSVKA